LLPYTNTTKQILVAAFRKSVNDNGQVQLLSVQVSIVPFAIYLLLQTTMTGHILYGLFAFLTTEQRTLLLSDHCGFHNSCLSVRLSVHLYIRPSVCLSDWCVCVYSSCLSVHLYVCPYVCPYICLSVGICICLFAGN